MANHRLDLKLHPMSIQLKKKERLPFGAIKDDLAMFRLHESWRNRLFVEIPLEGGNSVQDAILQTVVDNYNSKRRSFLVKANSEEDVPRSEKLRCISRQIREVKHYLRRVKFALDNMTAEAMMELFKRDYAELSHYQTLLSISAQTVPDNLLLLFQNLTQLLGPLKTPVDERLRASSHAGIARKTRNINRLKFVSSPLYSRLLECLVVLRSF